MQIDLHRSLSPEAKKRKAKDSNENGMFFIK